MNLCSENHDEIVYEGGRYVKCPLCEANDKIRELERDLEQLQEEFDKQPQPPLHLKNKEI